VINKVNGGKSLPYAFSVDETKSTQEKKQQEMQRKMQLDRATFLVRCNSTELHFLQEMHFFSIPIAPAFIFFLIISVIVVSNLLLNKY
jgi:hypothetical protein